MAWRGEVEDGLGWGGLVASKSEQREEARLAALERDAARYRWLRDKFSWTLTSGPDGTRISVHMPGVDVTAIGPGEDEFDAAIDAAMRK